MTERDTAPKDPQVPAQEDSNPPVCFISYSHDSPAHKKWVGELAGKLMEKGIDVILDQWDLEPGDDIPKFMEQSVRKADKVLMVCTDTYVRKADDGKGGVGYESMIVTGELVQNLGTSKFIPVIRQEEGRSIKPASVSTRYHVDLSEGQDIDTQFDSLLKAIHKVIHLAKPSVGKSPFPLITPSVPSLNDTQANKEDASSVFTEALEIARRQDNIAWRRLAAVVRKGRPEKLLAWRSKHEGGWLKPRHPNEHSQQILMDIVAEGVEIYLPIFAVAMAGILSGNDKFKNQRAVIDDLLHPKDWNGSGLTTIVDMPLTIAFVYQALHGSTCLYSDQLSLAVRLARERISTWHRKDGDLLLRESRIIGWPPSLEANSALGWEFLWHLPERWKWLCDAFGDADEYRASLCAYYIGLTTLELIETISSGNEKVLEQVDVRLDVPVRFPMMDKSTVRRGYRIFLASHEQIKEIWSSRNVAEETVKRLWPKWIAITSRSVRREYGFLSDPFMVHEPLLDDLA